MARPIEERMRDGFCCVYRPVLEDVGVRVFDTMREYREWCAAKLPVDLGFQPTSEEWPLTEHSIRDWTGVERRRDASDYGSLTRMKQVPRAESSGSLHIRAPYRRYPLDALAIRR